MHTHIKKQCHNSHKFKITDHASGVTEELGCEGRTDWTSIHTYIYKYVYVEILIIVHKKKENYTQ